MSGAVAAISSSKYEIFPKLLSLDATAVWAANQMNVPMASPAPGYKQSSPARSECDADYDFHDGSQEYMNGFSTGFLQALNSSEEPQLTDLYNAGKGSFGSDESFVPDLSDIAGLAKLLTDSESPDTDFLMNLELLDGVSGDLSSNACSPGSPGLSSCDDGYNSGDEILSIISNSSGSPLPPEDALVDDAPLSKPEESQVVPSSPPQAPPKPVKVRRNRGPRSLALHNGNGPMQLWQFLLNILVEGPPGLLRWTHDEPFEFKLLNPPTVAVMWGKVKHKPSMNYEKLSRGLRYYYGKNILEKVHGKRYCYQFQCDIPKILGYDPTSTDPKQNLEDAVCDSPDVSIKDEACDTLEECPPSVSSEDSTPECFSSEDGSPECWEVGPGLW